MEADPPTDPPTDPQKQPTTLIERLITTPEEKKLLQREITFGEVTELICEVMENEGVSVGELAARLGVDPSDVMRILDGEADELTIATVSDIFFHLNREIEVSAIHKSGGVNSNCALILLKTCIVLALMGILAIGYFIFHMLFIGPLK